MATQTFNVLSPDGFPIDFSKTYSSILEANEALNDFVKKYESQGYYSTVMNGERVQIPVEEIKNYCKIIEL